MPINKKQDTAEKFGKKNKAMNQKEQVKPSAAGKNEKKQAQKIG
jgi:hypothetical protein